MAHRQGKIAVMVLVGVAIVAGGGMLWWFGTTREASDSSPSPDNRAVETVYPVRVAVAKEQAIRAWVFAEGTARSVRREYLTFNQSGKVTLVADRPDGTPLRAGDRVAKGQVLAELDKRTFQAEIDSVRASMEEAERRVEAAGSDVKQAGTQLKLARTQYERAKNLVEQKAAPKSQLEEAEATLRNAEAAEQAAAAQKQSIAAGIQVALAKLAQAQVVMDEAQIVSPIDGVVAYLNIQEGYYFNPSIVNTAGEEEALTSIPMVVIDPSEFEITLDIPAFEAGRVEPGQSVLILPGGSPQAVVATATEGTLNEDGDTPPVAWQAMGEVFSINPAVNPGGRSIQIKVRTTSGAENLRDGMFVTCWIATAEKPNAVTVPFDVLLFSENRPYVFAAVEIDGRLRAERRDVRLGIRGLTARELEVGVKPDERLVTDGRFRLTNGAPIAILNDEPATEPAAIDEVEE